MTYLVRFILALVLAVSPLAASAQYTNQGPTNSPAQNSTIFIGSTPGWYGTIQNGVTAACGAGAKRTVSIPAGYTGSDAISAVTGGCTSAYIWDDRAVLRVCYSWSGSAYTNASCSGGGGGSGSVGAGTAGQVAQYPASGTSVAGVTLSGDATMATGGAVTLATVNGNTGACGDSSHTCAVTLDAKGRATAASPALITPESIGAAQGQSLPSGAIADFNYTQATNTTLTDNTGNGNNGTPCSGNAPTLTAQGFGWLFASSNCVELPSALNNAQTIVFSAFVVPLGTGAPPNAFQSAFLGANVSNLGTGSGGLITNSVAWNQFNFMLLANYPANGGGVAEGSYYPGVWSAGSVTTGGGNATGYHVFAVTRGVCGTSLDHVYIDGIEFTSYFGQGCSAGLQTSGNLIIGQTPTYGLGTLPGTAYRTVFWPGQLTAAKISVATNVVRNADYARGVVTATQPPPLAVPALNCIGDSITFGLGVSNPYCALLTLTNPPTTGVNNWGISGITLWALAGTEANRVGPICKSNLGPAVASIFSGTNDYLNIAGATAPTIFATLANEISTLKGAGCRVGVVSMLSRTNVNPPQNAGTVITFDQAKDQYNTLMAQGAAAAGSDFFVDFASLPGLGADNAYANPTNGCNSAHTLTPSLGGNATCFQSDGTHPTQAGHQAMADIYSNVYNRVFGHNLSNPNTTSASSYSMLPSDGALILTGTGAQTITLPDCTGMSGLTFYVRNNAGAEGSIVSISTAQTINGGTGGVGMGVGQSFNFTAVPNSYTVSGCTWNY